MPTEATIRLNVHLLADTDRCAWSMLAFTRSEQGVPNARVVRHGVFDLTDLDLVGVEAVAQALAVAVDHTT
jgi:hypothetical protein